eukprot:TRINITY_DN20238_c0_g1_i1.p1 TRINITY_DN20238_c0_g1~~TRINITY_DN20238_c0_g1_i1.p1  ORF type:complete len:130 (+),score=31.68 TRINITY_DN20238_c0_g1_i1:141-530(+)
MPMTVLNRGFSAELPSDFRLEGGTPSESQRRGSFAGRISVKVPRKMFYYDVRDNRVNEIPKEYLVYVVQAVKEYKEAKEKYDTWVRERLERPITVGSLDGSMPGEEIPALMVDLPFDNAERNTSLGDEW